MSEAFRSIKELARELRALTGGGREPTAIELSDLQRRVQSSHALEVPHFLWHWLADADIRVKDSEYRRSQVAQLETVLQQMEGPHAT